MWHRIIVSMYRPNPFERVLVHGSKNAILSGFPSFLVYEMIYWGWLGYLCLGGLSGGR